MSERCQRCGSELLARQRYCRSCGAAAAIGRGSQEEAPTQILPPDGQAVDPNLTTQLSRPNTDQVFSSAPTAHQPFYTQSQTVPLRADAAAPRPGTPWGRITAFVVLGLIGVVGLCVFMFFGPLTRHQAPIVKVVRHTPPAPPLPAANPGVSVFDEDDTVDTGEESISTTTVLLDEGASISLKNVTGNITVEGWDESDVEVKIIKRGGSIEDRKTANVVLTNNTTRMSLASAPPLGGNV